MQTKSTDVALVNPKLPYPIFKSECLLFHARIWPPLDLLNMATRLWDAGISSQLIDAHAKRMGIETTSSACRKVDKVVITTSTLDRWQCPYPAIPSLGKLIGKIKEKNDSVEIILFGAHGTIDPSGMISGYNADKVIVGDESGIVDAIECGDRIITSGESDVNQITPDYALTDPQDYLYEIFGNNFCILETTRGCAHNCSFCFKKMYGHYREKKLENVISELQEVAAKGYTHAYFIDLNFCSNRNRTIRLCEMIKKEGIDIAWTCQTRVDAVDRQLLIKMRSAGCRLVHLGIETHSNISLKEWGKGLTKDQSLKTARMCKKVGIETVGFFLLGFPNQNAEDWKKTIEFAKKLGLDHVSHTIVTPYTEWALQPYPATYLEYEQLNLLKKMISRAYLWKLLKPSTIGKLLTKLNSGYFKIVREKISEE